MNVNYRYFILLLTLCFLPLQGMAQSADPLADLFADEPEFLPVDEAFQFDFMQQGGQLILSWKIADNYYLYKKQFKTVAKQAELGEPSFPVAVQVEDEFFGLSDVFRGQLDIAYPIISSVQDGIIKIRYQGCADAGLCYPPTTKEVYLNQVGGVTETPSSAVELQSATESATDSSNKAPVSEQFELANMLSGEQSLLITLLLFLGLGSFIFLAVLSYSPFDTTAEIGFCRRFNFCIGINKGELQCMCQLSADCRFSRAHQAHKRNGLIRDQVAHTDCAFFGCHIHETVFRSGLVSA